MKDENLHSKIELLQEQIENIERSGFFTEKQIDKVSYSLREELATLKSQIKLYGMTPEQYAEGRKIHSWWFSNISPALKNTRKVLGTDSIQA